MQLEVSPYLLVDTLRDSLVIQVTFKDGVNVYRSKDYDKGEATYNALKAKGDYHMLAFVSGEGECLSSEYKPYKLTDVTPPKEPAKPTHWKEPVSCDPATQAQVAALIVASEFAKPGGIVETAKAIEEKRVDLSGFTTGLPSGFKTGK